jgi:hypothetical protein
MFLKAYQFYIFKGDLSWLFCNVDNRKEVEEAPQSGISCHYNDFLILKISGHHLTKTPYFVLRQMT